MAPTGLTWTLNRTASAQWLAIRSGMGTRSCPELCCRCACLQPCIPNGPWTSSAVSLHPGWTPQSCHSLSPALFPAPSSFAPDWHPRVDPGPGSSLVLGAVGGPRYSPLLCLLCSAPVGWCLAGEGTACAGVTLGC